MRCYPRRRADNVGDAVVSRAAWVDVVFACVTLGLLATATVLPLDNPGVIFGCHPLTWHTHNGLWAKLFVHGLALVAFVTWHLLAANGPGKQGRRVRLDWVLLVGGSFVAIPLTLLTMAFAQDALVRAAEYNPLGCPTTWLQSLIPASYWATPAIALVLDAGTSIVMRRALRRGWSPVFTTASLILQIVGAIYIIDLRYVYS